MELHVAQLNPELRSQVVNTMDSIWQSSILVLSKLAAVAGVSAVLQQNFARRASRKLEREFYFFYPSHSLLLVVHAKQRVDLAIAVTITELFNGILIFHRPGSFKKGENGCIQNCGTDIVNNDKAPSSFAKVSDSTSRIQTSPLQVRN